MAVMIRQITNIRLDWLNHISLAKSHVYGKSRFNAQVNLIFFLIFGIVAQFLLKVNCFFLHLFICYHPHTFIHVVGGLARVDSEWICPFYTVKRDEWNGTWTSRGQKRIGWFADTKESRGTTHSHPKSTGMYHLPSCPFFCMSVSYLFSVLYPAWQNVFSLYSFFLHFSSLNIAKS